MGLQREEPLADQKLGNPEGETETSAHRSPIEQPASAAVALHPRHRMLPSHRRNSPNVETLLWIGLAICAIATRFWNLGYRALHHDESIHTYHSWFFAIGDIPYRHDPLSHGPFLFHANALVYLLFGGSDGTSRLLPALGGVCLVLLPWLLRGERLLGRWGALAAGFMLLISPTFLYYTRYIRHDVYTCIGALLLFIAIFRYLERPQRRWMMLAFLSLAFMLTNHEIVFAIVLAFALVLWGTLLLGSLRWLIPFQIAIAAVLGGVFWIRSHFGWTPLPLVPWENPTEANQREYYVALVSNPLVACLAIVGVLFAVNSAVVLHAVARANDPDSPLLDAILGRSGNGSLERGVLNALRDPVGLAIGAGASLLVFFALFTTLFTNLDGIASSTFAVDGTVLYWLGQHDVRRGSQPWFYFVTESFQYEWLTILFATAASVVVAYRLIWLAIGRGASPRLLFTTFLGVWFGFLFLVLSWAGEKMPWLLVHILLPAILLGAVLIDEISAGAQAWQAARTHAAARLGRLGGYWLVAALVALAFGWFLLASRLTGGSADLSASTLGSWWQLALYPAVALLMLSISLTFAGARQTASATLVASMIVLSLFQVHAGFRLAFIEGDTARDTLIYNTTSPDVTTMARELDQLSMLAYGDDRLTIGYDDCAAWPLTWYFKDMPGANRIGGSQLATPATLPDVVVGVPAPWDRMRRCYMPEEIEGYTAQTYVLRWHEPELAVYRRFAIAPELPPDRSAWNDASNPHGPRDIVKSVWSSVGTMADPRGQQRLFRLLMFRELPEGLNGYLFRIYVRNDLMPLYNDIRYGE